MVKLTHETRLLDKIGDLAKNKKIYSSVGLAEQKVKSKLEKLIPTTRQRLNATKFYLDAIENMNYAPYLRSQPSSSEEETPLIDFSDSDLQVQINVSNSETFPLVVFIVLNGFFSNLVSLEDCIANIINMAYDLIPSEDRPSYIRQALDSKIPIAPLTTHLRTFHAIGQDGKPGQNRLCVQYREGNQESVSTWRHSRSCVFSNPVSLRFIRP